VVLTWQAAESCEGKHTPGVGVGDNTGNLLFIDNNHHDTSTYNNNHQVPILLRR
jgi:hypothetical protein